METQQAAEPRIAASMSADRPSVPHQQQMNARSGDGLADQTDSIHRTSETGMSGIHGAQALATIRGDGGLVHWSCAGRGRTVGTRTGSCATGKGSPTIHRPGEARATRSADVSRTDGDPRVLASGPVRGDPPASARPRGERRPARARSTGADAQAVEMVSFAAKLWLDENRDADGF